MANSIERSKSLRSILKQVNNLDSTLDSTLNDNEYHEAKSRFEKVMSDNKHSPSTSMSPVEYNDNFITRISEHNTLMLTYYILCIGVTIITSLVALYHLL